MKYILASHKHPNFILPTCAINVNWIVHFSAFLTFFQISVPIINFTFLNADINLKMDYKCGKRIV